MAEVWTPPAFDDIATSELVTAAYLNQLGNSLRYLEEVAYVEFASDVSVTATAVGAANQIVSAGAVTYEAVPHMIEVSFSRVDVGAATFYMILRDGTTVLGTLFRMATGQNVSPVTRMVRLTPTAASHTYNVAGWNTAAVTTNVRAGNGGAAGDQTTDLQGFIRVTRVPT